MEPEFFGPYRLQGLLGRGGMGEVYQAYDTVRKRTVALKLLHPGLAHDDAFQSRFRRESELAARLAEPHVIPIHDYGEVDGRLFLDMRLVTGVDLHTLVTENGPLSPIRAVGIVSQAASALDAAHADGLVHRDVKPSNVLLTTDPRGDGQDFVYLVDFGIARSIDRATMLTTDGAAIGTVDYMAPERFTSPSAIDGRVDVYALACMLFELLTGRKPFVADELGARMYAHLMLPPPRPTELRPDLPAGLDEVVVRGMAKNPDERYAAAGELAAAARAVLRTSPEPRLEPATVTFAAPQPRTTAPPIRSSVPDAAPTTWSTGPAGAPPTSDVPAAGPHPSTAVPLPARRRVRRSVMLAVAVIVVVGAAVATVATVGARRGATAADQPAAPPTSAAQGHPRYASVDELAAAVTARVHIDRTARLTFSATYSDPLSSFTESGFGSVRYDDVGESYRLDQMAAAGDAPAQSIGLIVLPSTVYIRGLPDAAKLMPDRPWVELTRAEAEQIFATVAVSDGVAPLEQTAADPLTYLADFKEAVTITESAQETVDGLPATRYALHIDVAKLAATVADPTQKAAAQQSLRAGSTEATATLWVDAADRPLRVDHSQLIGTKSYALTGRYVGWGEPVDLSSPPADQLTAPAPQ